MTKHPENWLFISILVAIITNCFLIVKAFNHLKIMNAGQAKIVPHPQQIGYKDHCQDFIIDANTVIVLANTSDGKDSVACDILNSAIIEFGKPALKCIQSNDFHDDRNAIVFGELNKNHPLLDSLVTYREMFTTPSVMKSEEYRLDIDSSFIVLVGKDKAATFFGIQTLIQLLKKADNSDVCVISAARIRDYPDMPIRSLYYGFHLKNLDNDTLLKRGYHDIQKFARYKFNMIGLDNHHYGHLDMEIPDGSGKKYGERLAEIFDFARKFHLQPRVGGWPRWFGDNASKWNVDMSMLEGIRTTQTLTMKGTQESPLRMSSGHTAYKVMYDFNTGKSWDKEPVIVTDESGQIVYEEDIDYKVTFGKFNSPFYDRVIFGEGEPAGFPFRRGESSDPPTTISRTPHSRISDGQKVKISFSYLGPDPFSIYKFRYCRSDPRIHIDGPNNFIWRWCTQPITYLDAKIINLEMDEIRVLGWDKRCLESGKSRSQIFVDDIKYYYDTIKKTAPDAKIFMWSDMIDPNHNARIYKTLEAADLIVDYGMSDIIMVPWEHTSARKSINFLVDKGFSVMASVQDQEGDISVAPLWAKLLRDNFKLSDKRFGLMHAPWDYDYDNPEGIERLQTAADHAWSIAPYIVHLPIGKAPEGKNLIISAVYEGDQYVFDGHKICTGPLPLISAYLYYRKSGQPLFQRLAMIEQQHMYKATIPGEMVTLDGVEYYIAMSDQFNTSFAPKSSPDVPYKISVQQRLITPNKVP